MNEGLSEPLLLAHSGVERFDYVVPSDNVYWNSPSKVAKKFSHVFLEAGYICQVSFVILVSME